MDSSLSIGVIIPSYNEADTIKDLISSLLAYPAIRQILVVDDSPTEETVNIVASMARPEVRAIKRPIKGGRGSAVLEGLGVLAQNSELESFIEMDADFSHPPKELVELALFRQSKGLELVIASRYLPASRIENWPLSRRLFSKMANFLASVFLNIGVSDYTNGYRCYSRRAAELISSEAGRYGKGFIALSEILVRIKLAGYSVGEVPTIFINRVRGESSVGLREVSQSFLGLFKIAWFYRKSQILKGK